MYGFTEKGKEWLHHVRSRDATRNHERESGRVVRRDQSTRWHEGKTCRPCYVIYDVIKVFPVLVEIAAASDARALRGCSEESVGGGSSEI